MVYIQHCLRDSQISHCANLNEYEHVAQGYFFTFFSCTPNIRFLLLVDWLVCIMYVLCEQVCVCPGDD